MGIVRDAALAWMDRNHYYNADEDSVWYAYPLTAETYDGVLNDINGFHVKKEDAWMALGQRQPAGPVPKDVLEVEPEWFVMVSKVGSELLPGD